MTDTTDTPASSGTDDAAEPTDDHAQLATVPVHPSGLDGFEPVEVRADVHIPERFAVAIAYRLGLRVAQGRDVTEWDVDDLALDYATARERFIVKGTDRELVEWLREEAGVDVPAGSCHQSQ